MMIQACKVVLVLASLEDLALPAAASEADTASHAKGRVN